MPARTCECGECRKCKHREYMNEWYRRPGNAEKVRNRVREYKRTYVDKRSGHRSYNKEHEQAGILLRRAVYRGEVTREACEECGNEEAHGHHGDYSKPLEVKWLCSECHGKQHRQVL